MLKSDLILKMYAEYPHLYQHDLDRIVNIVLDEIVEALKDGGRVEFRGFGAFTTKARDGRIGRNPRTGSPVVEEARRAPYFRAGKELRVRLRGSPARAGSSSRAGPQAPAPRAAPV